MEILKSLNSWPLYAICGTIIACVALICIIFIIRAYRAGLALGIDKKKMKTVMASSATFTIIPSIGILLGVIALSGSLGLPWPWLRLSVIGALHYETQVAQAAAEQVGLSSLSANEMTIEAFSTICLLMSMCIMWSLILPILFSKTYLGKIGFDKAQQKRNEGDKNGFADKAMNSMFIGLVSAYIGSYIGDFASGKGFLSFRGDWTPLVVVCVSATTMAIFLYFTEKKKIAWLDNFSVAVSMLVGMSSAVVVNLLFS